MKRKGSSEIADSVGDDQVRITFKRAEEGGLRLAVKGKILAIMLMAIYLAATRGVEAAPSFLLGGGIFAVIGIIHYRIIGSPFDKPWVKYAFLTIDIALLSVLIAIGPTDQNYDLPKTMIFRFNTFPYYFAFIAIAGFSFSPGLMLWAGIAGSAGWIGAFSYVLMGTENPLFWSDVPSNATRDQFLAVFLSPDFMPFYSRVQESLVLVITAALLSVVMLRARNTVFAHLRSEAERRSISDLFGRHVPKAVADMMIAGRGRLDPTEREATVLFADIEGFTSLTERVGAPGVTSVLNAYFDDAANIIGANGGIITQFQGDAILAVFNLPAPDPEHAARALNAGLALLDKVSASTYWGQKVAIRVGIATGRVVAGNVGGGGRENYTVHGDAVNSAARLEGLNKELGTRILVSATTVEQSGTHGLREQGRVDLRGRSEASVVFTRA